MSLLFGALKVIDAVDSGRDGWSISKQSAQEITDGV